MKYKNFEDLPVWQGSIQLTVQIFKVTKDPSFRGMGDLANQIQRASLSIPNNISEGFERGTTNELLQFLYYAKGSAGEVRSICHVLECIPDYSDLKSDISNLKSSARSISKQLGAWAFSLQESDIKGTRHLTEKSKSSYQAGKKSSAFLDQLKREHEERIRKLVEERRSKES